MKLKTKKLNNKICISNKEAEYCVNENENRMSVFEKIAKFLSGELRDFKRLKYSLKRRGKSLKDDVQVTPEDIKNEVIK